MILQIILSCSYDDQDSQIKGEIKVKTQIQNDDLKDSSNLIIDDFPEIRPQFFIVSNGDMIEYFKYFDSPQCYFPQNLKYVIRVSVDTSGTVELLKILKKEGIKPDNFDIYEFIKKIKALPAVDKEQKVPFTMTIPLEKK